MEESTLTNMNVATALTVYGIETCKRQRNLLLAIFQVATALTVYGIETQKILFELVLQTTRCNSPYRLRY